MGVFRNRYGRSDYRSSIGGSRTGPTKLKTFADPALSDGLPHRSTWKDHRQQDELEDTLLGFAPLPPGSRPRVGWLVNMVTGTLEEPLTRRPVQAVDLFFIADDGHDFRASIIARPYMYVAVTKDLLREAEITIRKQFQDQVAEVSVVTLEDISMPNHLAADEGRSFLKVETRTTGDLYSLRQGLAPIVDRNLERKRRTAAIHRATGGDATTPMGALDAIEDIREYDVAPVNRLAIDQKINVGYWYKVSPGGDQSSNARLEKLPDIVERAAPVVLAYDIECTKKPLKFPDAESGDEVMMISWMVDGKGFLGINREVVSKDIDNFEYKPHAEYHGEFEVFNEANEKALLERFFAETRIAAPRVFVTFNGDYFDWPFVEKRAALLGLDMGKEIGMRTNGDDMMSKVTKGRAAIHMDVFHWVNRDSYLPQGSRGLKAVTRALLGFEPEEIPPEEMMTAAIERPDEMAKYSVSDAVCTYYLYMKYVHPFIFSLCNIIPLNPDDVLRKGSGTLCEMLLMCQAREKRIVAPNKYNGSAIGKLTDDGHVLESETYIGGHVEAIRTGVYRSDLPLQFNIDVTALEDLEKTLDETLRFAIEVEGKMSVDDVTNYAEVRAEIVKQLHRLRENPRLNEKPLIYHLDVSAMYPNIILTNRLQPHAMVTPAQCAACDFNGMSECQRDMEWTWRGEFYPASRGEAEMIQRRPESNRRGRKNAPDSAGLASFEDEESRKNVHFRKRLKEYCRTNYRKTQETRVVDKTATVCQRENPFYVDTVRAFRNRRYEYKALLKKQKKLRSKAKEGGDPEEIKRTDNLVVLYDSLQLAHKCILNSFYGYVMRRGARWYSMEMAGIVTNTGGLIIRRAREFIEKVGLPLELDTDGIWCVLPVSFPENFTFQTKSGKDYSISYICSVFNSDVAANFTNHQYQDLVNKDTFEYEQRSECSILFEVDGPYKAMVLPASLEEGKTIKKRYAVFNDDGSLAELKGFEIKRRGELKLIKEFQGEIFSRFLEGRTLSECYEKVGETCNKWFDVLATKGEGMTDAGILELLVEQNNMSKPLSDYIIAGQKSCAITCATRLKEFLGSAIVKDKGLAATYVIARKPEETQVTGRAIPVKIFDFPNEVVKRKLLRKWTKNGDDENLKLRNLLDWEYYKGRLANAILKIVTIPAALQAVDNPVPRVEYPAWLVKKCRELRDKRKQQSVMSFFKSMPKGEKAIPGVRNSLLDNITHTEKLSMDDIEDMPLSSWTAAKIANRKARAVVETRDHLLQLFHQPHPNKHDDYAGWLRYAKNIWRAQRAARVYRSGLKRQHNTCRGSSMGFLQKSVSLLGRGVVWQNVSISPVHGKPGEYQLWVLPVKKDGNKYATGDLHSIPLHVKRVLYYNSRVETPPDIPGVSAELVPGLALPRSREAHYLFRLELQEDRFQKTDKDLTSTLTDAGVLDGVFGAQAPLDYETVLALGTFCVPKRSVVSRMQSKDLLRKGLTLNDIVSKGPDTAPYLKDSLKEDAKTVLNQAFVYGSHALDGSSRALYAVIAPAAKLVHVVAVRPSANFSVNLKRIWKRVSEEKRDQSSDGNDHPTPDKDAIQSTLPSDCTFTTRGVRTRKEAWSEIQQALSRIRNGSSMATRGGSSRLSLGSLEVCVPLAKSYPVVTIASNADDGDYMPVGWESSAISLAFSRFTEISNWLPSHIHFSRFAGIPLGNMSSTDVYSQALDVLVGRELLNRDHVLWASNSPQPDLGGFEEDDSNLQHEIPSVPEVSSPGSYRTICIDTELSNLTIATILSSSHVNQLEGTDLAFDAAANGVAKVAKNSKNFGGESGKEGTIGGRKAALLDEMAASAPAFRIIKDLVASWDKAASSETNPHVANISRGLLDHLLRWTRSESSMLYDPALARFLGWLITKVFRQLVGELKDLGATVVFASMSRLILATPKTQTVDGLRYAGFLEKTVKSKPLFRHVHFEPLIGVYSGLLFVDRFNYGALPAPEEASILSGEFGQTVSKNAVTRRTCASREIPYARMMWDMARYLPIPVAVLWTQVVEEFIRRPMVVRLRAIENEAGSIEMVSDTPASDGLSEQQIRATDLQKKHFRPRGDGFADEVQDFTRNLTGQLLEKIHEIREKTPTLVFPSVPSILNATDRHRNPALEFVRSLCYVLGLDPAASEEVAGMRRSLLRLLGVREFAKEAQFKDPALPVPLRDVICTYCNAVVDLDVARDARLWTDPSQSQEGEETRHDSKSLWACEYCGNRYDMRQIELDLMRSAQKMYTAYQVQDLKCMRCRMVKRDNMGTHCNCSGSPFQLSVSHRDFRKQLHALESLIRLSLKQIEFK
ncbi:unnamed protein product [Chondrus crispus]|uniref:DNA polymerase epsilon catalytic subunit n=1 Tax=Chondrus crispus TaxID=2769 RepID=R7QE00_CHOCR|nr:unnamed protein product [Chondrus crispus]CDF35655.1 unnamed protein product [Chondrus crispus]|eukprot:XP_005715474.1 unnamed protein product [Chondrus crispus]